MPDLPAWTGGPGGVLDLDDAVGETVDTHEQYKVILLSDGTVKAVPESVEPPVAPADLQRVVRLTSVRLTWAAAAGAARYIVSRDGAELARPEEANYRDTAVLAGQTYAYRVATVDVYGQVSPRSAPVEAFIDPELNQAPTVAITSWPPEIPTSGYALVRVNAADPDSQSLALELEVDQGALAPTDDPSVWRLSV